MQGKQPNQAGESHPGHNSVAIEGIAPSRLKRRKGDPRKYSESDIERAVGVLRPFPDGGLLPIIVNSADEILIGGLLVEAAKKLGIRQLNVIRQDGLTPLEEQQYSIALNQLLTLGQWDAQEFEACLRDFEANIENFSHADLGFANGELDRILGIAGSLAGSGAGSDVVPPVQQCAVSRPGTLWHAGRNLVLVGDATNADHVAHLMGGQVAAQAITDPPFGCKIDGFVSAKGKHREFVEGSGMSPEKMSTLFLGFTRALALNLRKGALVYIFIDWRSLGILQPACEEVFGPLVQFCCWVKDRAGMGSFYRSQHELVLVFRMPGEPHVNNVRLGRNGRNRSNVWDYPSAASSRTGREGDMLNNHPTPKPVELVADTILDCTAPGDRVIDCFLGSGTTLIAAERTGRICHGMDLDPLYADVAIRRWQAWTGLDAVDSDTGKSFNELDSEREQEEGSSDE